MKKVKAIIGLAIFALACYSGFLLVWPHYKAWEYESDARDIVRFSVPTVSDMREKLLEKGLEIGIPIEESDIQVTQSYEGEFMAAVAWVEQVDILGYYQHTYEFSFEVGGRELGTRR
ncbi:MAG: hypothetical protein GWN86_24485 [Desulfobacterales bacterium]|nr:hypothetical protein [Desulfobacterales bacterium]